VDLLRNCADNLVDNTGRKVGPQTSCFASRFVALEFSEPHELVPKCKVAQAQFSRFKVRIKTQVRNGPGGAGGTTHAAAPNSDGQQTSQTLVFAQADPSGGRGTRSREAKVHIGPVGAEQTRNGGRTQTSVRLGANAFTSIPETPGRKRNETDQEGLYKESQAKREEASLPGTRREIPEKRIGCSDQEEVGPGPNQENKLANKL
jgi:hypothetical protein